MVFQLIGAGAIGGLLSSVFGGGGGASIEVGTSKKTTTNTSIFSPQSTNNLTDQRTFSFITGSPGASITTKKEASVSQTPSQSIPITIVPTSAGSAGGGSGGAGGLDIGRLILVGGLVAGGLIFLQGRGKKK